MNAQYEDVFRHYAGKNTITHKKELTTFSDDEGFTTYIYIPRDTKPILYILQKDIDTSHSEVVDLSYYEWVNQMNQKQTIGSFCITETPNNISFYFKVFFPLQDKRKQAVDEAIRILGVIGKKGYSEFNRCVNS